MTLLSEIVPLDLLVEMIADGYIRKQTHPEDENLLIFNYTEKAQFEKVWNAATRECRGLIVRISDPVGLHAEVVARPFPKFFNLSEHSADEFDPNSYVRAYDKMDGSLGILYTAPDGRPAIATRGSFASPQAVHATALYRERYEGHWNPNPYATYLFEIVFPENRIVLDYGSTDDLILLGDRMIETGAVFGPSLAVGFDYWPGPSTPLIFEGSLENALALEDRPNAEGVVLRFTSTHRLVKVKQEDYVALHRIVFGLNERAVWEHLSSGQPIADMIDGLPDEFHDWVKGVANRLQQEFLSIRLQCATDLMSCQNAVRLQYMMGLPEVDKDSDPRAYRKEIAAYISKCEHPGIVFTMLDGRDYEPAIWKMLYPAHSTFAKQNAEALA